MQRVFVLVAVCVALLVVLGAATEATDPKPWQKWSDVQMGGDDDDTQGADADTQQQTGDNDRFVAMRSRLTSLQRLSQRLKSQVVSTAQATAQAQAQARVGLNSKMRMDGESNVKGAPPWYHYMPPWWLGEDVKIPHADFADQSDLRGITKPPAGVHPYYNPYDNILVSLSEKKKRSGEKW